MIFKLPVCFFSVTIPRADSLDRDRHDFLGRSMARGAFMIWTHNLKNISYDDQFVPTGAPSNEAYQGSF